MDPATNPFVVTVARPGYPRGFQNYYCATRAMAERLEMLLLRSKLPQDTVFLRERV